MNNTNDIDQKSNLHISCEDMELQMATAIKIESGREAAWRAVAAKTCLAHKAPVVPMWRKVSRVAAVLIPLALIASLYTTIAPDAERATYAATNVADTITLPDGSTAILGEGSTLTYYADADGRHTELEGIALFKVRHDAGVPFSVDAQNAQVQVLGTTFSVEHWKGQERVRTRVQEGRVAVTAAESQETLTAGQEAIYDKGLLRKEIRNIKEIKIDSRDMSFQAATLQQVADELLTCYHKEISDVVYQCAAPDTVVITTVFKDQSLESVLAELNMHFDKKLKIHNGYLTISD